MLATDVAQESRQRETPGPGEDSQDALSLQVISRKRAL